MVRVHSTLSSCAEPPAGVQHWVYVHVFMWRLVSRGKKGPTGLTSSGLCHNVSECLVAFRSLVGWLVCSGPYPLSVRPVDAHILEFKSITTIPTSIIAIFITELPRLLRFRSSALASLALASMTLNHTRYEGH
jgi:hypothetical protein